MSTETKELTKDGVLKTLWAIKDDDKFYFDCLSCAVVGVKKELAEKDKLILGYENQVIMASSIIEEKDRIIAEQKLALNEAEKKIKQLDTKPY